MKAKSNWIVRVLLVLFVLLIVAVLAASGYLFYDSQEQAAVFGLSEFV